MKLRIANIAAALAALTFSVSAGFGSIVINEIRADNPSGDINEYFELSGSPGDSLTGLTYVVIGDGSGALGSGVVEAVIGLSGSIPADGYFLAAENTHSLGGSIDLNLGASGLNFENDDTYTHLLVSGFSGTNGADLDTNDDGILDSTPWTSVIDSVAFIAGGGDLPSELAYSSTQVGPDAVKGSPWHLYRLPNSTGGWLFDSLDNGSGTAQTDAANYSSDTPGYANPEPATLGLLAIAGVLGLRRRRA